MSPEDVMAPCFPSSRHACDRTRADASPRIIRNSASVSGRSEVSRLKVVSASARRSGSPSSRKTPTRSGSRPAVLRQAEKGSIVVGQADVVLPLELLESLLAERRVELEVMVV
jgi:hypothetical protein